LSELNNNPDYETTDNPKRPKKKNLRTQINGKLSDISSHNENK
jgi:hypothetical protein